MKRQRIIGIGETIIACALGAMLFHYAEPAIKAPFRAYSGDWQEYQDVKMRACYTQGFDQETANACLMELNVFI